MSQPNITCTVCGGSDFIADAGSFFCLECNTQAQDVREEVFDEYFGTQKGATRVQKKSTPKASITGEDEKLTSWEVLNHVLKGMTDELVDLGANPELKIVALQLWASYLRKLEIAFTSVEVERKPKLGYAFKPSDAEIIYGVTPSMIRRKTWKYRPRSKSPAASSVNSSDTEMSMVSPASEATPTRRSILRRLAIRKKALASAEYKQMSQETEASFSQTLEELDSSDNSDAPKKIKLTKHARSLTTRSSRASSTEDELNELRKMSSHEIKSLRNITVMKVVGLVNVALALTQKDIQLSDFIRWVDEGHISLKTSRKFLPERAIVDNRVQKHIQISKLSYMQCHQVMMGMCRFLEIEELSPPDLNGLVDRYCLELQLPGEIVNIVKRLLSLTCQSMSGPHRSTTVHRSKLGEVQVMSAIVFVMKLLFSLDDCTEYRLSHTASEINRASKENGDPKQLFVWSDWTQFVECRKAVLACHHLPTRAAVYGEAMGRDTDLFLQHYKNTAVSQPINMERKHNNDLDKTWTEALTRCLRKLIEDQPESTYIKFPASLTPFHSGTQLLLDQHPERVAPVRAVLSQDFTRHSLEYILDHDRTVTVGLTNDLNILQEKGAAATFNICPKMVARDKNHHIPRYKINQTCVKVDVVKSIKCKRKDSDEMNQKNQVHEKSLEKNRFSDLSEVISDDSDEEETGNDIDNAVSNEPRTQDATCSTTLDLFKTGSQYWSCYIKLSVNQLTQEEFEVFAMDVFPTSFLWLLKECSRTICVPTKDLYANIITLEDKHKVIVNEAKLRLKEGKRKRTLV